jgi:hypothetical protein
MAELGISLLSSAIAGLAVAVTSWVGRRRRIDRMRAFFGVQPGSRPVLIVSHHHSSPSPHSVHLHDAAGAVDLAATLMRAGAEPELVAQDEPRASLGAVTEVCLGGPTTNARTATHLRHLLPGVTFAPYEQDHGHTIRVGDRSYRVDGGVTHVLVAKVYGPQGGAPVFVVSGQWAAGNRAAARHLARHHRDLARRYGPTGPFALVLRLRGVQDYGVDSVDHVDHVTTAAFTHPDPHPSEGPTPTCGA